MAIGKPTLADITKYLNFAEAASTKEKNLKIKSHELVTTGNVGDKTINYIEHFQSTKEQNRACREMSTTNLETQM